MELCDCGVSCFDNRCSRDTGVEVHVLILALSSVLFFSIKINQVQNLTDLPRQAYQM